MDIRAGTNEQKDDEQEGLEVEERGLRKSIGAQRSHQSGQEKYGPWWVEDCALRKRAMNEANEGWLGPCSAARTRGPE